MSDYTALISYGRPTSGSNDSKILTSLIELGMPITGWDSFETIYDSSARFYGELQSGEIKLTDDGTKVYVKSVWMRTYCTEGTVPPRAILMVRALDQDDWYGAGDQNAVIDTSNGAVSGSAASNLLGLGSGYSSAWTTPVDPAIAKLYVDGVETSFTRVDGSSLQCTSGYHVPVNLYWSGEPNIRIKQYDFIESSEGFHQIITINKFDQLTLDYYTGVAENGIHRPAYVLPEGEGETVFSINQLLNTVQIRLILIPQDDGNSSDIVKPLGGTISFVAGDRRHFRQKG